MTRITPENLTILESKQIVLIGTNEAGIHGAGIARYAMDNWGARFGQGFGIAGKTFGIPTKDWNIRQLSLDNIKFYVDRFIDCAQTAIDPDIKIMVTKVGCGLAGYTVTDIAPMFRRCTRYRNIWLPQEFLDFYNSEFTNIKTSHIVADTDDGPIGINLKE